MTMQQKDFLDRYNGMFTGQVFTYNIERKCKNVRTERKIQYRESLYG